MRKRILLLPVLVAALLTLSASAAQAGAFVLTLEDVSGGTTKVITDNTLGDMNTNLNGILFMGAVGSFNVTIFGNTYTPGPSGAPVQMNISNFRVTSTTAGDFRATLSSGGLSSPLLGSSDGVSPPVVVAVATAGATLTAPGSVAFQSFVDGAKVFTPAASGTIWSDAISGGTLSGTSFPEELSHSGVFDLVTMIDFNFDGGGTMNANTDLQVRTAPVPEPMTLLLFGPGMAGFAAFRRRRRLTIR